VNTILKLKKIISVLVVYSILFAHPASAQIIPFLKNTLGIQPVKPDKLFENKQYAAAAKAYEIELIKGKSNANEVRKKIGLCYLKINRPQMALPHLQQLIDFGIDDADLWYQYGLALQQTGSYQEAITAFEECLKLRSGHPYASLKIESCRFAIIHSRVSPHNKFRAATEVNTAGGEFGTSLFANQVVYYSSAAEADAGNTIDPRTGLQYVNTYMTRLMNKRLLYPQKADNSLPKYVTDRLFAYDSIARCVYFAYCDPSDSRCGIFTSKFAFGKWTDPKIILPNKKDQVSDHPAIANGGKRLYFTSNMLGGIGQTDIWYMDKLSGDRWGQPVNVGNIINTIGREEYPFVHADTLLFFASDGHAGYGGLDLFCSVIKGNTFSPPVNLRRPFNSPGDDFGLVISGNMGIISSSRNETMSDDLYLFEGVPSFKYLSGRVTDHLTGAALDSARLTLTVDGKAIQQTVSDNTGYYGFFLRDEESPMMYARTFRYKPALVDVPFAHEAQFTDILLDIQLQESTIEPVSIELYHKITGIPVSERTIICFNNDGESQILRTDAAGAFKLITQEDQREYWIKFPDGQFLTESIILNEKQKIYSLAVQPFNDQLFTGWLLFKKGLVEATEMSQALIPRIAAVIKNNPGMVFQIEGFCDTVFELHQQNLALQRAEYIVRRLVDEGVDQRQLNAFAGTGKTDTGEKEEAYQRRVEIKIKK